MREKERREKESENIHTYIFVYIINYMCTCTYISVCISVYLGICVCVYTYELIIQIHNVHMYLYTHITYIHTFVPYIGRPTRRNTCVPVITGSVSFEMRVMEQVARMSSTCRPASGRLTKVRVSTSASVLS